MNCPFDMLSSFLPVFLDQHLVGRLIGKQGRYVSFLKQNSGAKIYISTLPYTQEFQICHIEGESQGPGPHIPLMLGEIQIATGWEKISLFQRNYWTPCFYQCWFEPKALPCVSLQVRSSRLTKPCPWLGRSLKIWTWPTCMHRRHPRSHCHHFPWPPG